STFAISPPTETKKAKPTDKDQAGPIRATDKKEKPKEGAAKQKTENSELIEKPKERKPATTFAVPAQTETADTKKAETTDKKLSVPIDLTGKKEKPKESAEKPAASTFTISSPTETKKA